MNEHVSGSSAVLSGTFCRTPEWELTGPFLPRQLSIIFQQYQDQFGPRSELQQVRIRTQKRPDYFIHNGYLAIGLQISIKHKIT